ncbi:MAG: glycosyltransferase family 2 protein [Ignavibacteria bacterium]|nr:glycosyltransferase family 2 protein [Ignavibacteria bacterium]
MTGLKEYNVSVILTLFNSRNFLNRSVNSVLNQTYRDFELIIVDDGSTDETETELFPLLKANPDIKYIRHSNRKHPLSLNTGIINSSGKYITFLDSDDEYLPEHLFLRVDFMEEFPETDLIYSPALLIGDEKDFYVPDAADIKKLIHLNECIIGGTFFGKRKIFAELQGFRNVYSHDSDFIRRASAKGNYIISKFDELTYKYYRNNPESIINKMLEHYYDGR